MKEVVLRIEDSAFEKFVEFVQLCPMVEVINVGDADETRGFIDECVKLTFELLQINHALRKPGDYTYIMKAVNEGVVKDMDPFASPVEYLDYLTNLGLEGLPGKSTIYDGLQKIEGKYPNWTYIGEKRTVGNQEILRRKNIVVQFLSAFFKAKRELSESGSER